MQAISEWMRFLRWLILVEIAARKSPSRPDPEVTIIDPPVGRARTWVKLLRVHQWAKNGLVVVPLFTSHQFDIHSVFASLSAFVAFSLAASAVYVVNDLIDIEADRQHPTKKLRPLAAGTIPVRQALMLAAILVLIAIVVAVGVSPGFAGVLAIYLILTTAYTFVLKRKMIVDIVTLATLYTLRVIGGAEAISVTVSEWLLAFSMFIFTALALIKRYVELAGRVDAALPNLAHRDYRNSDLDVIAMLACAAAFNAVTVFALYISSDTVRVLYRHPKALWLVCPVLVYWLGRAVLIAHRRLMDDDPIIFALTDRNSLISLGVIGLIMISAI